QARARAPMGTLTLGRAVSLQDYEDFARAFSGISLAQAAVLPSARGSCLQITVAGPDGAVLAADSETVRNLVAALRTLGDPMQNLLVQSYQPLLFRVSASLLVDPDYQEEPVRLAAEAALRDGYAFARRTLAQPVTAAEVLALLQRVTGISGVRLRELQV